MTGIAFAFGLDWSNVRWHAGGVLILVQEYNNPELETHKVTLENGSISKLTNKIPKIWAK